MASDPSNSLFSAAVDEQAQCTNAPVVAPAAALSAGRAQRQRRARAWRVAPLAAMLAFGTLAFALGWQDYLSLPALHDHRDAVLGWRDAYPIRTAITFGVVYAAAVALSLPGAIWMTIVAGFLFGPMVGTLYVVGAATIGASLVFLAARYAFAGLLRRKAGGAVATMEAGFRRNALSYLLFLRLVPVFPFWLVNLVPAILGVPLRTFVVGTLIGIFPGSVVYCMVGNGLSAAIDNGREPDPGLLLSPPILLPLLGLAALSLLPVLWQQWRLPAGGKAEDTGQD